MKDILQTILTMRLERGWTEYRLAEESGIPQTTISCWYKKNSIPKIPSLKKISDAFGITLSQLLAEGDDPVTLTDSQKKLMDRWTKLDQKQQDFVFSLIDNMNTHAE